MMPDQIHTIDGGCQLPDIGFPSGPDLYPDSDVHRVLRQYSGGHPS